MTYFELMKANSAEYREARHDVKHKVDLDVPKLKPLMQKYYYYLKNNYNKNAIIITGRIHPGEV